MSQASELIIQGAFENGEKPSRPCRAKRLGMRLGGLLHVNRTLVFLPVLECVPYRRKIGSVRRELEEIERLLADVDGAPPAK